MSPQSPEEVLDAIGAAVNAQDLDAFMELFEPDGCAVPPGKNEHASGLDDIRTSLEPLFAANPSTNIDLHGILRSDGLAMSHSHFTYSRDGDDGERIERTGMGTVVTRRQSDGSWRIVFDYPLRK